MQLIGVHMILTFVWWAVTFWCNTFTTLCKCIVLNCDAMVLMLGLSNSLYASSTLCMDQDGWWQICSLVYVSGSGSCRTVVGFCWLSITMTEWVKICKTEGAQPVSIVCFLATCTWYGFHSCWFLFFSFSSLPHHCYGCSMSISISIQFCLVLVLYQVFCFW